MKSSRFLFSIAVVFGAGQGLALAQPMPLGNAKISYIQNDVSVADIQVLKVQSGQVAKTPAKLEQPVTKDQVVVTGGKSRAELTFADGTIARIGQHSVFSFSASSRKMDVQTGSALFNVPKGRGTTEIKAGPVTASIVGTTLLVQVFGDHVLIYVYEGTVVQGDINITAGKVLRINNDGSTALEDFDVNAGVKNAALFSKFIDAPSTDVIELALQDSNLPAPPAGIIAEGVLNSKFRLIQENPPTPPVIPPKPPKVERPEPPKPPCSSYSSFSNN
jgi:hypothetical protein